MAEKSILVLSNICYNNNQSLSRLNGFWSLKMRAISPLVCLMHGCKLCGHSRVTGHFLEPKQGFSSKNIRLDNLRNAIHQKNPKNTDISINYNYIFNQDRFTFPREWGREPFFTFLPRERMEGTADSHAIALKTEINLPKHFNSPLTIIPI